MNIHHVLVLNSIFVAPTPMGRLFGAHTDNLRRLKDVTLLVALGGTWRCILTQLWDENIAAMAISSPIGFLPPSL
jgi:hypothetical protein